MLAALSTEDLYRLYQILDDLAHMGAGVHLAELILKDPDIRMELPVIRSYYSTFFSIHEVHLAEELLKSAAPRETLKSFPLYPRYEALVKNQIEAMHIAPDSRLAFIGCGPVPASLILMSRLYGIRSVGLDNSFETVELSTKVIKCLGLEKEIEIIHGDDSCLKELDWEIVLVSALAEPKARIFRLHEEHGWVDVSGCVPRPKVGERLSIVPVNVSLCINLYDHFHLFTRDGILQKEQVDARGCCV